MNIDETTLHRKLLNKFLCKVKQYKQRKNRKKQRKVLTKSLISFIIYVELEGN